MLIAHFGKEIIVFVEFERRLCEPRSSDSRAENEDVNLSPFVAPDC